MHEFSFQEYFLKGCLLPCIFFLVFLTVLVLEVIYFIRTLKRIPRENVPLWKKILAVLVMSVASMCFVFLVLTIQTLQYGIHLLGESESDAVSAVGRVETVNVSSLPPVYRSHGEVVSHTAEVQIDGNIYYFMSAEDLCPYIAIRFSYLPKSKMVLSYQQVSISEWEPLVEEPAGRMVELSFVFILLAVCMALLFFSKTQYYNRRLVALISAADEKWDKNEVRYHSSYRNQAVAFFAVVLLVGGMLSVWSHQISVFLPICFVFTVGMVFTLGQYRNWKLEYSEDGLVLYPSVGRIEVIRFSHIISIEEKQEAPIWSKGQAYRIVKIRYESDFGGKTVRSTIKLDFRYQVGIRRFLAFLNEKELDL